MFGLAAIPAAILLVGILSQHESPHWLVRQGREDEARSVLRRVRAEEDIDEEIDDVRDLARREASGRRLLDPKVRPALIVGLALAVFQQVTGINTVIYYAPTLLKNAGFGNNAALLANVAVGAVNVMLTIVAIWLLDRVGRRPLLLVGTAGMVVGMAVTAVAFTGGTTTLHGGHAILAVIGLMIYTGSFAVGLGPVFWLLIAEIYPLGVRARAMSVATIGNWAANFVVTISFLTILNAVGGGAVFTGFGVLSLAAVAYFYRRVPETKGRSLQQIERDLSS
jgi:sugar porter (SP) family MFS transporter